MTELERDELLRYRRHLVLDDIGEAGQRRLKAARVLLIGAGGLGSPAGLYLAAAGIGTLGIADFDRVEASNLHRQVLFTDADIGRPKVEVAAERLRGVNPHIEIIEHDERVGAGHALGLFAGYDVIVDGSDNFATRYLVNDACVLARKPLVWGAVLRFDGQVSVFCTDDGPCYRCLFPQPPAAGTVPNCAEGGVLGVLPGIIGSLQANEVIKLVVGIGEPLIGRFLTFDALRLRFRELKLARDLQCPACGKGATIDLTDIAASCAGASTSPRSADQETTLSTSTNDRQDLPFEISVTELRTWLDEGRDLDLIDVREPYETRIAEIDGARLIPLGEISTRTGELDRDRLVVVHCHHGGRSANAVHHLRAQGFAQAINLGGGIDAWSLQIDPSVARY